MSDSKFIELCKAYEQGKTIQNGTRNAEWYNVAVPDIGNMLRFPEHYRVKPETVEVHLYRPLNGDLGAGLDPSWAAHPGYIKTITVDLEEGE